MPRKLRTLSMEREREIRAKGRSEIDAAMREHNQRELDIRAKRQHCEDSIRAKYRGKYDNDARNAQNAELEQCRKVADEESKRNSNTLAQAREKVRKMLESHGLS